MQSKNGIAVDARSLAENANQASKLLAACPTEQKNQALTAIAEQLEHRSQEIFQANQADLDRAEREQLAAPLMKRLKFDRAKLDQVIEGIQALLNIPDPIGEVMQAREISPNLNLYKIRCPIGVLAMIFESRPDAAVQIATLALKSGNAVLLKGGSEALQTIGILSEIMHEAAVSAGIPRCGGTNSNTCPEKRQCRPVEGRKRSPADHRHIERNYARSGGFRRHSPRLAWLHDFQG